MRRSGPPIRQPAASQTDVFERFDTANSGSEDAPLHDPCMIAHLLPPALFHARHINEVIGTKGDHTPGTTAADGCRVSVRAPKAVVMGGVDWGGFYCLLSERLRRLCGKSLEASELSTLPSPA